jgi:hypothetical protein
VRGRRAVEGRLWSDKNEEHDGERLQDVNDHNLIPEALGILGQISTKDRETPGR